MYSLSSFLSHFNVIGTNSNCTFGLVFFFFSTPATLDQNYVVCELQQKVNVLYSFLRSHLKKKSIVFFASCKEVWLFPLLPPQHFKTVKIVM